MRAHTPGPWIVTHELRDSDEAVCDLVNQTWVIKGHHMPLGNWNADAQLIAAAPDLLAALILAEDVMSRVPFSDQMWPTGMHPMTGISQIRAAIAKAGA